MANYTKSTNFATKDSLNSGNPLKIVKGTEIDTEFNNIQTAIATKADTGGILAVASGGTGATTAAAARASLLPAFASNVGKVLAVNSSATDVEFVSAGGVGTVTSVAGTGTVNGLSLSGTVTSSGNITLGGTLNVSSPTGVLPVANGGTGSSSLSGAGIPVLSGTNNFTGANGFGITANADTSILAKSPNTSGAGIAAQNNGVAVPFAAATSQSSGTLMVFYTGTYPSSITTAGEVRLGGPGVLYIDFSDYRLKENIVPLSNAVTKLKQLAPKRFTFIDRPEAGTIDGFIAHELQAVVPQAVSGEKDEIDQNGNPRYQGVDSSNLVPLLTAALQEALVRIEALEVRMTALES
jgi:hypothetical protein